jgi:hypothetical protein
MKSEAEGFRVCLVFFRVFTRLPACKKPSSLDCFLDHRNDPDYWDLTLQYAWCRAKPGKQSHFITVIDLIEAYHDQRTEFSVQSQFVIVSILHQLIDYVIIILDLCLFVLVNGREPC